MGTLITNSVPVDGLKYYTDCYNYWWRELVKRSLSTLDNTQFKYNILLKFCWSEYEE